jgi:hypothetical protein
MTVQVITLTYPRCTFGSLASLLAAILYKGNHVWNHKLWNILSTERCILHMQVMLLLNGKFTMGKLKSSLLSQISAHPLCQSQMCSSRYEADTTLFCISVRNRRVTKPIII